MPTFHEVVYTFEKAVSSSYEGMYYDSTSHSYKYRTRTGYWVDSSHTDAYVGTRRGKDGICLWLSASDAAALVAAITNDVTPLSVEIGVYSDGIRNPSEIYFGNCDYTQAEYDARSIHNPGIAALNPTLISVPFEETRETIQWFTVPTAVLETFVSSYNATSGAKGFTFQPGPDIYNKSRFEFTFAYMPKLRINYRYKPSTLTIRNTDNTVAMGSAFNATINAKTNEYRHVLYVYLEGADTPPAFMQIRAGDSLDVSLNISINWCDFVPNDVQAIGRAELWTYPGTTTAVGTQIGVDTVYFTLRVPDSIVPTAGTIGYATDGTFTVPASGLPLTLSLSGYAGAHSSTITQYSISFDGSAIESTPEQARALEISAVKPNGANESTRTATVTATVTDSRGRTAKATRNLTIYKWELPYFTALTVLRCDEYGVVAVDGRCALVQGTYECWPVNNENSLTSLCSIKIRDMIDGTETDAGNLTSGVNKVIGNNSLSTDRQYEILFMLTDEVTSATYSRVILTSAYAIHIKAGATAVAFGQAASVDRTVTVAPSWQLIVGNNIDVGDTLENLTESVDVLDADTLDVLQFSDRSSNTNNGVTFTADADGNFKVVGTATSTFAIHNFYYDRLSMPAWLIPGSTYNIDYSSNDGIRLQVWLYKDNAYVDGLGVTSPRTVTIPSDANGAIVRLVVDNGVTVDETVSPRIYATQPNRVLAAQYRALEARVAALENI